ncbi:uncharacterized protein RHIMIDRAFT_240376 [Rhizopus microsporus ATCC 52813]|uniref:Uncharacterized protein n=1 Tax=Rhizopus microsporus ATCC 52813 TaxID=1340429 RepID=A0A2G4SLQ7_RHIZD|nr:uncharacterized protein RHIMIDRAFT_240376 [Rhizopus microsporus ATCC 52813]PHZ09700.1 hypothetical protein RHIMIDRAFT_240376 [Rhizopus microsporus ATCC 52813]
MIKAVAGKFAYASVETFQKLKLYFVQASDEHIRLWSIQYAGNGIFNFNRENKGTVTEETHQVQHMIPLLLDFFYDLRVDTFISLGEAAKTIEELKVEDEAAKKVKGESSSQEMLLYGIICPEVFRLSYHLQGKAFERQSFVSLPESD